MPIVEELVELMNFYTGQIRRGSRERGGGRLHNEGWKVVQRRTKFLWYVIATD